MENHDRFDFDVFYEKHPVLGAMLAVFYFIALMATLFAIRASEYKEVIAILACLGILSSWAIHLRASPELDEILIDGLEGMNEAGRATIWAHRRGW